MVVAVPHSAALLLAIGVTAFVLVLAVVVGGREERRGAALVALGWLATLLSQRFGGRTDPVVLIAVSDAVVLIGFLRMSWRSERVWPLAACACQGVAMAVHAIRAFSPRMAAGDYLGALSLPSYAMLAVLALGALSAMRRRRKEKGLLSYR